jgi:hypothetical protein
MNKAIPALLPMTPEAKRSIQGDRIKLHKFPFRIGRESRLDRVVNSIKYKERRKKVDPPNNDLYLIDRGKLLNVSREHVQIEKKEDGTYEVVDRGSACGTIVADYVVGGHDKGGRYPLENGNIIIIGTPQSQFRFKFQSYSE